LVLCDYLKSFDYRERSAALIARCDASLVDQIVGNLLDLLDPVP
jgi:hypothetical protein